MSVSDIIYVDMEDAGDGNYSYTVTVKEPCSGKIQVCLSPQNTADAKKRLSVQSQWFDTAGSATVEKSLLEGQTDLYLYLLDEDTGVNSTIVKVYYEQFRFTRLAVSKEGILTIFPDRGRNAWQDSSEIVCQYMSREGILNTYRIALPCTALRLSEFDVWKDTPKFTFQMRYYMKNQKAEVLGALSEEATICLAPPAVTGAALENNTLTVAGSFTEGLPVNARIMYQETPVFSGTLSKEGTLDVSSIRLEEKGGYTLVLSYKGKYCDSYDSVPVPVIPGIPKVTGCQYSGGRAVIEMERDGIYQVSDGNTCEEIAGRSFSVPKEAEAVKIRMAGFCCGTVSTGPSIEYRPASPGFYPLKADQRVFYAWQEKPDSLRTDSDRTVEIAGAASQAEAYAGAYFTTRKETGSLMLTIKKEIYGADVPQNGVRDDYKALLLHYQQENETVSALKQALREYLPMQKEDFLFYQYGFASGDGYTDISEGMQLLTEYTLYQNIPDADNERAGTESAFADLSGFAGTGVAAYQVVGRNGKLKVEPFAGSMEFLVEPPSPMTGDNKLCGGAGVADLLYTGFARAYMRLVYPAVFATRNSVGNLEYSRNICLITADSLKPLEDATVNLRRGALSLPEVSYHYFRGRSVIVPRIGILINKKLEWVSLGTTLGDVKKSLGMDRETPALKRRYKGGLFPVYGGDDQIPLFQGDCVDL